MIHEHNGGDNMRKWFLIVPAIASLAVGTFILARKDNEAEADAADNNNSKKDSIPNLKQGSYSFVSGFKDAKTVELKFAYDADRFSFRQIEDEFLTFTSVSHAAAIFGEDFNIQIEYSDYAAGEDLDAMAFSLKEKQKGFASVLYGGNAGYMYYNGDNVCFVFPAAECSYILVTVIRNKNSDIDYRTIPENADVAAILESISITSE